MLHTGASKMNDADLFENSIRKDIDEAFVDFKRELDVFLAGRLPNGYVYGNDVISVYTRKGTHMINGALFKCLDVGTIVVAEQYRNRGVGMKVIDYMHKINPFRCTYVESIQNEQLYDRLKRYGWSDVDHSVPPCVFKLTPLTKG
jgi:hypothetical protein